MIKQQLRQFGRCYQTAQTRRYDPSNFVNVHWMQSGVGMASAALPFVPVFLPDLAQIISRLDLLTSPQRWQGLILSIPWTIPGKDQISSLVQHHSRLGLSRLRWRYYHSIFIPAPTTIVVILAVGVFFTIPLTLLQTMFSVVLNSVLDLMVAFELMSRRVQFSHNNSSHSLFDRPASWKVVFPLNYQIVLPFFL